MFTGLITHLGKINQRSFSEGICTLQIEARELALGLCVGESVAINGVCLTVVKVQDSFFDVEVVPETLAATTIGNLDPGSLVNLERALAVGDRLGGHFVLGHVDGVARIVKINLQDASHSLTIEFPETFRAYIIPKGSIAVDGISLTVQKIDNQHFETAIIPHTWQATNLHTKKVNDRVNLEVDFLGKYVVQYCRQVFPGKPAV